MDVSIAASAAANQPPVTPVDAVAPVDRRAAPAAPDAIHGSRLSVMVELIASLTGREVKLVPPTAYLVSKPAPPVEIVAPRGLFGSLGDGSGPIEIGIASVLRTGTAERMLLESDVGGALHLRSADIAL